MVGWLGEEGGGLFGCIESGTETIPNQKFMYHFQDVYVPGRVKTLFMATNKTNIQTNAHEQGNKSNQTVTVCINT